MSLQISQEEYKALSRGSNRKGQAARKAVSDPAKKPDVATQGFNGPFKEAFILSMIGDNMHHRYIVHHPIGVTNLDEGEWIISSQEEVDTLLQRRADPYARARENFIQTRLKNSLPAYTNLRVVDGKLTYHDGRNRDEYVNAAKRTLKEAWNAIFPPANYVAEKGKKAPKVRPKAPADAYLIYMGNRFDEEARYRAYNSDAWIRELASTGIPGTGYTTRKGALDLQPQATVPGLKGLDKETAQRTLMLRAVGQATVGNKRSTMDSMDGEPQEFTNYVESEANQKAPLASLTNQFTMKDIVNHVNKRKNDLAREMAAFVEKYGNDVMRPTYIE